MKHLLRFVPMVVRIPVMTGTDRIAWPGAEQRLPGFDPTRPDDRHCECPRFTRATILAAHLT